MGVDMGTYPELIAHRLTIDEIRDHVDADSLHFLSLAGMMRALGRETGYCNACFTGVYPVDVEAEQTKTGFERAIV
jgi:amidophosphoribosyltransferase